jgi:DNA-binding FadR family transcriptional regulator/DNA-binding MarR family transcriptional regulator
MLYANDRLLQKLGEDLLQHHDLELSWYEVMLHIGEARGEISQRALVERMLLGQSGLSRLLTKMEGAGLVRRTAPETDRRTLSVQLTTLGRERLRRAAPTHIAGIKRWFGDQLTARQAEAIKAGLEKVVRGLAENKPGSPADTPETVAIGPSILSTAIEPISVSDTLIVRDALEPLIIADAVRYATTADIDDLHRLLNAMASEIDSPVRFLQADWELHRRLCRISPNDVLQQTYSRLLATLEQNVDDVMPDQGLADYLRARLQLHARLITAVADGDHETAAELAQEHRLSSYPLRQSAAEPARPAPARPRPRTRRARAR